MRTSLTLSLPLLPRHDCRGWPKHPDGYRAEYVPLAQALTDDYSCDAHIPAYSCPNVEHRLADKRIFEPEYLAELGGCILMVVACFDVDGPNHICDDDWWAGEKDKIVELLKAHPGAFVYRTRGGYRIVYLLIVPFELRSEADADEWSRQYLAWLSYLSRCFGIKCDPVKDWARLYRVPHATRPIKQPDGSKIPGTCHENLETIGDAFDIGFWEPALVSEDWPAKEPAKPPKPPKSPKARNTTKPPNDRHPGLFYQVLVNRDELGDELELGNKWCVPCPLRDEHSDGDTPWDPSDSSTVLYAANEPGGTGNIYCAHTGCGHEANFKIPQDWFCAQAFSQDEIDKAREDMVANATDDDSEDCADFADEPTEEDNRAKYLIPELQIGAGPTILFIGNSYVGKTAQAQAVAISVASGELVWGRFENKRGRVLHVDGEQGSDVTWGRYRQLAKGLGLNLRHLRNWIRRKAKPPKLNKGHQPNEAAWIQMCRGYDLVIVDNLRTLTFGIDENSSEMAEIVYMLGTVSEKTGATIILIAHSSPYSAKKGEAVTVRGSSAIEAAAGKSFVFERDGVVMTVTPKKLRALLGVKRLPPFRISEVKLDGNGIQYVADGKRNEMPQVMTQAAMQPRPAVEQEVYLERVRDFLKGHPKAGVNKLRKAVGGSTERARRAKQTIENAPKTVGSMGFPKITPQNSSDDFEVWPNNNGSMGDSEVSMGKTLDKHGMPPSASMTPVCPAGPQHSMGKNPDSMGHTGERREQSVCPVIRSPPPLMGEGVTGMSGNGCGVVDGKATIKQPFIRSQREIAELQAKHQCRVKEAETIGIKALIDLDNVFAKPTIFDSAPGGRVAASVLSNVVATISNGPKAKPLASDTWASPKERLAARRQQSEELQSNPNTYEMTPAVFDGDTDADCDEAARVERCRNEQSTAFKLMRKPRPSNGNGRYIVLDQSKLVYVTKRVPANTKASA